MRNKIFTTRNNYLVRVVNIKTRQNSYEWLLNDIWSKNEVDGNKYSL